MSYQQLGPLPIDLALLGSTVAESARLRERHVLPVVIDANVIIEDALYRTGHEQVIARSTDGVLKHRPITSSLSNLMAMHAVRVYGKPDLIREVTDHLPRVASRRGRDPGPALALIRDDYLPHMRLVDPSGITLPDAEDRFAAVLAVDADDELTARLSRLLDPSILLTRDRKGLLRFGFGLWVEDPGIDVFVAVTNDDWLKATLRLRQRAFEAHVEVGGRLVEISGGITAAGSQKLVGVARDHPIPAALLLAGAVALVWATRDAAFWPVLARGIVTHAVGVTQELEKRTRGRPRAAAQATMVVEAYRDAHASPGLPVSFVARALSIAPRTGLTVQELRAITGHRFAVRDILAAHPAFVEGDKGRWHLGHAAQMPP